MHIGLWHAKLFAQASLSICMGLAGPGLTSLTCRDMHTANLIDHEYILTAYKFWKNTS